MAFKIDKPKKKEGLFSGLFSSSKSKKEEDSFEEESTESEERDGLFKTNKADTIKEINDDLYSENMPVQVKNEDTLIVEANGKKHEITRRDLFDYHKKYAPEENSNEITKYREFGSIHGENEPLDNLAQEVHDVFDKLDDRLGGYKTLSTGD